MQIEYAEKCVNKAKYRPFHFKYKSYTFSSTILGVICKDGVILGAEKLLTSKLMMQSTDPRLFNIDTHAGMVSLFLFPKDLLTLLGNRR